MKKLDKLLDQIRVPAPTLQEEISKVLYPLRREALRSIPMDDRRYVISDRDPDSIRARMDEMFIKHGMGYMTYPEYLWGRLSEAWGFDVRELIQQGGNSLETH